VFRDEVIDYATRLSQAAVSVDLHIWACGFRGFDLFSPHAAVFRTSWPLSPKTDSTSSQSSAHRSCGMNGRLRQVT
jgi:acetyl esterase/lipase